MAGARGVLYIDMARCAQHQGRAERRKILCCRSSCVCLLWVIDGVYTYMLGVLTSHVVLALINRGFYIDHPSGGCMLAREVL